MVGEILHPLWGFAVDGLPSPHLCDGNGLKQGSLS